MSSLRRLSTPDLQLLRGIILTVIEEGDIDGEPWAFYEILREPPLASWPQAEAKRERSAFCDAIQQRIFATAEQPLPERIGSVEDS